MKRALLTFALSALFLVACGKSSSGGGGGGGPTSSSTQDVYGVVSTGAELAFNDLTGGANDVAVNPVTHLPAIAYYDKSASVAAGSIAVGALKYAWMNASGAWTVEIVDANFGTVACGTALSYCVGAPNVAGANVSDIIKLAFTSKGVAVIAYVFGASANTVGGTKQIRYAERINTTAQVPWAVSVAFAATTAAAPANVAVAVIDSLKGVALQLDSSDLPHIYFNFFAQTTTANSFGYYLFRAANGGWTTTSLGSIVTGTVTLAGTGSTQTGMVMCPSTGFPWVVASKTTGAAGIGNQGLIFQCTAMNTTTGCTAWTTININTACTAASCFSSGIATADNAGYRADITYDPANSKMLIGYFDTTTTLTQMGESQAVCGNAQATGAAGSWGAMSSFGAANNGLNGFRLAASSTKWLASFLNNTTSIMFSTATAGAWLASGNVVDGIAAANVGVEGVGLAYDSTSDTLWSSYAYIPGAALGATGNDIKVGHAATSDIVAAGLVGTLYTDVVDQTVTAENVTVVPAVSAAKAPNGTVGYASFFQDINVATFVNNRLYYGTRGGTTTNPTFSQNIVVNAQQSSSAILNTGAYPSLTYDANSNPLIAFYDGTGADKQLDIAASSNAGTYFSLTQVDHSTADVGMYPSIQTFGTAVGVAYYDNATKGLRFARYTTATGWKKYIVDGGLSVGNCANLLEDDGSWATLRFTSTGAPVIAYQSNATNLKLAYATQSVTGTTFTWTCMPVDVSAAQRGAGIDMQLSASDFPYIAHFDATAGTIRIVTCSKAIGTCVTGGPNSFTGSIVNGSGTLNTVVTKPSLQLDPNNKIWLGFYSAAFQGMTLASQASGATAWTMEQVDEYQSGSSFISGSGQYSALLLNSSNYPMAIYRSTENWLKYFSREPK